LTDVREPAPVVDTATLPEPGAIGTTDVAVGLSSKPLTPGRLAWRRFKRHKLALLSAVVLVLIIMLAVLAPLLTKYTPTQSGTGTPLKGPTAHHLMGTDQIGRDVWTQVLYGGRVSLLVGVAVAVISTAFGAIVGSIAGFYGKWVDNILMRVTDLFLAIPLIVILIIGSRVPERQHWAQTLMGPGKSIRAVVTILTLFFWMPVARIVRGLVLSLKEREFVIAARTLGIGHSAILRRHILPHLVPAIIVYSTLGIATSILIEASLSYLGIGVPLPQASWGQMISQGQQYFQSAPWLLIAPGVALIVTVLAFNLAGDWLTDLLDPETAGARR
jgi:peptide/nickel transport system permease protein